MPIPAPIRALMKDTVTVKTKVTDDAYGNKVLSAGTSVRARVEYGRKRMWGTNGEFVDSTVQVYLADDVPGLTPDGEVTLPDGTKPPMRDVRRHAFPDQSRSVEIYI